MNERNVKRMKGKKERMVNIYTHFGAACQWSQTDYEKLHQLEILKRTSRKGTLTNVFSSTRLTRL